MKSKNLHVGQNATDAAGRILVPWIPPLLWAGTLFVLSSIPGTPPDLESWMAFPYADKVAHAVLYAVLGWLLARATSRLGGWPRGRAVAVAILLGIAYGISDEIHQIFVPQRSPEVLDVLADAIGATAGALAYLNLRVRAARRVYERNSHVPPAVATTPGDD